MENICYTVISGPYDTLKTPTVKSNGWRYICFTDQNIASNPVWEIHPIPEDVYQFDIIKRQRCLKTQPHKYLPEHKWSVYVDASIEVKIGMWKLVKDICKEREFSVRKHPVRDCIYKERIVCVKIGKDTGSESEAQIQRYKAEGFPEQYGLNETNILIRRNCENVITVDDMWWNEIRTGSHRDQLSFNYCLWKLKYTIHDLDTTLVTNSIYFKYYPHKSFFLPEAEGIKPKVNICIVHFNTPELTYALIKSIKKFTPNSNIYIFDNSTTKPFLKKEFDDIIVFDNTKGKYIDFDTWLNKYPNRTKSPGRLNKWGSAKHCISVEKCMELLGDEFILLDSDILLKNDITPLYNSDFIYVAGVETQSRSTIRRVLPYICYINTPECRKRTIHYFDENYMHGLCYNKNNSRADSYDTGAGFYMNTLNELKLEIDWAEWVEHLGGGSWLEGKNKMIRRRITGEEWLEYYSSLWK